MDLVLRVIGWPDDVPDRTPLSAHFDTSGGLIGRAETARLQLPDPQRSVSRFHAHVSCSDGTYYLEDMGSTNPVVVNGKPIPTGQAHQIRPGDRIGIARYLLAVEFDDPDFPATQLLDPTTRGLAADIDEEGSDRTQVISRLETPDRPAAPSVEALWKAFVEGARLQAELSQGLRPELMRNLGTMLRSVVTGARRLSPPRTQGTGRELDDAGAQPRQNNPVLVAGDDNRALLSLLRPPPPGFLPGPAAIDDLFDELAQQNAAQKAAMRVALERMLSRIEPVSIEKRAGEADGSDALVPLRRKAKLWDTYLSLFRRPRPDTVAAWQESFGKLYTEAYVTELSRLKKQRR
jgi:FHA domain-containing protein